MSVLPGQLVKSCRLTERSFIIALYLLSSASYSTSTMAWFATQLQKISLCYWYIYGLVIILFCALLGVTPAEIFLVFLPLSVSVGICLYTICGGPIVNLPSFKRCAEGQNQCERVISIDRPRTPVSESRPWKFDKDLEMNIIG